MTASTTRTAEPAATAPASSPRPRRRGRTVALAAGVVVIGGLATRVAAWNRSTTHPVSIAAAARRPPPAATPAATEPPPIGPPHQLASNPRSGQVRRCSRVTLLPSRTDQMACRCRNDALRPKRSRPASDDRDGDAFRRKPSHRVALSRSACLDTANTSARSIPSHIRRNVRGRTYVASRRSPPGLGRRAAGSASTVARIDRRRLRSTESY